MGIHFFQWKTHNISEMVQDKYRTDIAIFHWYKVACTILIGTELNDLNGLAVMNKMCIPRSSLRKYQRRLTHTVNGINVAHAKMHSRFIAVKYCGFLLTAWLCSCVQLLALMPNSTFIKSILEKVITLVSSFAISYYYLTVVKSMPLLRACLSLLHLTFIIDSILHTC